MKLTNINIAPNCLPCGACRVRRALQAPGNWSYGQLQVTTMGVEPGPTVLATVHR